MESSGLGWSVEDGGERHHVITHQQPGAIGCGGSGGGGR